MGVGKNGLRAYLNFDCLFKEIFKDYEARWWFVWNLNTILNLYMAKYVEITSRSNKFRNDKVQGHKDMH